MNHKILLLGSSKGIGLTFYNTRLAINLKKMGNDVDVFSDKKAQYAELSKELEKEGIRHYYSNSIDSFDFVNILKSARQIRHLFHEREYDVIHLAGLRHTMKANLGLKVVHNRPLLVTTIGVLRGSKLGKIETSIGCNLFPDKNIALCEYTKNELKKLFIKENKIIVIPLAAPDLEWFDYVADSKPFLDMYGLQDVNKPVIFYAASHFEYKGFKYYLYAAKEILKKVDATIVLGGKGPLTNELRDLARNLKIDKNVIFTGWISNYHMPYILSKLAHICVSTSLVEQLPSYVMECMAAKKPVIAYNVGGIPELIEEGKSGFLISKGDYLSIADRIITLINDTNTAKRMGLRGREIVEEKYNMNHAGKKLVRLYFDR